MASGTITMVSEKKHELSEIETCLKEKMKERGVEFAACSRNEAGGVQILHTLWEQWYIRTGSYAALSILIMEYDGIQKAEIISAGGKEVFFSLGAENNFAGLGAALLSDLGFERSKS